MIWAFDAVRLPSASTWKLEAEITPLPKSFKASSPKLLTPINLSSNISQPPIYPSSAKKVPSIIAPLAISCPLADIAKLSQKKSSKI